MFCLETETETLMLNTDSEQSILKLKLHKMVLQEGSFLSFNLNFTRHRGGNLNVHLH